MMPRSAGSERRLRNSLLGVILFLLVVLVVGMTGIYALANRTEHNSSKIKAVLCIQHDLIVGGIAREKALAKIPGPDQELHRYNVKASVAYLKRIEKFSTDCPKPKPKP